MKKECVCCGKSIGMLTSKVPLADGVVCSKCWADAGFGSDLASFASGQQCTVAQFMERYKNKQDEQAAAKAFHPTKAIGLVAFDDNTNTVRTAHISGLKTTYQLFRYDQIIDFELLEDGESISKGGLGRAVAGGVLFGGVGAVVGAVTGGKKTKSVCKSMRIKITLRNFEAQTIYIDLITVETKCDSSTYKKARQQAQDILSALQVAVDKIQATPAPQASAPSSVMDEILKLKQLLDMGAITQEEFEAKKKQLLAL